MDTTFKAFLSSEGTVPTSQRIEKNLQTRQFTFRIVVLLPRGTQFLIQVFHGHFEHVSLLEQYLVVGESNVLNRIIGDFLIRLEFFLR